MLLQALPCAWDGAECAGQQTHVGLGWGHHLVTASRLDAEDQEFLNQNNTPNCICSPGKPVQSKIEISQVACSLAGLLEQISREARMVHEW